MESKGRVLRPRPKRVEYSPTSSSSYASIGPAGSEYTEGSEEQIRHESISRSASSFASLNPNLDHHDSAQSTPSFHSRFRRATELYSINSVSSSISSRGLKRSTSGDDNSQFYDDHTATSNTRTRKRQAKLPSGISRRQNVREVGLETGNIGSSFYLQKWLDSRTQGSELSIRSPFPLPEGPQSGIRAGSVQRSAFGAQRELAGVPNPPPREIANCHIHSSSTATDEAEKEEEKQTTARTQSWTSESLPHAASRRPGSIRDFFELRSNSWSQGRTDQSQVSGNSRDPSSRAASSIRDLFQPQSDSQPQRQGQAHRPQISHHRFPRTSSSIRDFFETRSDNRPREQDQQAHLRLWNPRMWGVEDEQVQKSACAVYSWLQGDWTGCSSEQHDDDYQLHEEQMRDENRTHGPLSETYRETTFPYSGTDIGLTAGPFPNQTGVPRSAFQDAYQLKECFEGREDESLLPKTICLHCEDAPEAEVSTTRGTDSVLMFGNSFGMFKTGLSFCFIHTVNWNIDKSLHVQLDLSQLVHSRTLEIINTRMSVSSQKDQGCHEPIDLSTLANSPAGRSEGTGHQESGANRRTARLKSKFYFKDIPHMYIGSCHAYPNSPIYIAWPRMIEPNRPNNYITRCIQERFYDRVLRPAFKLFLSAETFGNLPSSQRSAELQAKAKSKEQSAEDAARKTQSVYFIPPDDLTEIWAEMNRIIEMSLDLHDFQDMILFLDVKNIKARQERHHLFLAMDDFDKKIEKDFDEEYITMMVVDIAKSHCAVDRPDLYGDTDSNASVYFWKDCCLRRLYATIREEHFAGMKGNSEFFTVTHLKDASCLTVEPPRTSELYRSGVRYIQVYDTIKTLLEAHAIFPFENSKLSDLAVDDYVHRQASQLTGRDFDLSKTRGRQRQQWEHMKKRVWQEVKVPGKTSPDSLHWGPRAAVQEQSSKGARFEVRLLRDRARGTEKSIWWAIKRLALEDYTQNPRLTRTSTPPSSLYVVKMRNYLDFVRGNLQKYIGIIEIAALTSPPRRTLQRTVFIWLMIKVLQSFLNSNLERSPLLSGSEIEFPLAGPRFGLGFRKNSLKFGFCWLNALFDWEKLCLHDQYQGKLIGHVEKNLLTFYQEVPTLIIDRTLSASTQQEFSQRAIGNETLARALFKMMVHELFKEYRTAVWAALGKEHDIRSFQQNAVDNDEIRFCHEGFKKAILQPIRYLSRTSGKLHTAQGVFALLWKFSESDGNLQYKRKHFAHLRYRYHLKEQLSRLPSTLHRLYYEVMFEQFFKHHPVIPYPNVFHGSLIYVDGKRDDKHRKLFATRLVHGTYEWAGSNVITEEPEEYPGHTAWSTQEKETKLKLIEME